jgi:hypothetical protein
MTRNFIEDIPDGLLEAKDFYLHTITFAPRDDMVWLFFMWVFAIATNYRVLPVVSLLFVTILYVLYYRYALKMTWLEAIGVHVTYARRKNKIDPVTAEILSKD